MTEFVTMPQPVVLGTGGLFAVQAGVPLSEAAGVYASAAAGRDGVADAGNAFNAIFTHRLQHLPRVMGLAIHALMDDRDCMAAVLSDEEGADQ